MTAGFRFFNSRKKVLIVLTPRMPFSDDLRAGYFTMQFNMSWFWNMIDELNETIKFVGEDEEDNNQYDWITYSFEKHIETNAYHYIIHSSFDKSLHTECDCDNYDTIWLYLYECARDWVQKYPNRAVWTNNDDNDEDIPRVCCECDESFTPSVGHRWNKVCDDCVSEKKKEQQDLTVCEYVKLCAENKEEDDSDSDSDSESGSESEEDDNQSLYDYVEDFRGDWDVVKKVIDNFKVKHNDIEVEGKYYQISKHSDGEEHGFIITSDEKVYYYEVEAKTRQIIQLDNDDYSSYETTDNNKWKRLLFKAIR